MRRLIETNHGINSDGNEAMRRRRRRTNRRVITAERRRVFEVVVERVGCHAAAVDVVHFVVFFQVPFLVCKSEIVGDVWTRVGS